jgi:FkbM family methyltransferase
VETRLTVDLRDEGVSLPIFLDGFYEPAETRFLSKSLRQGDIFVDIGANIGYFTTYASKLVGRRGKVIAFEPDPHNCRTLTTNIELNSARNVVIRNVALGSEARSGFLYRSKTNFGDHRVSDCGEDRERVPISILRFDQACAEIGLSHVDLIKIDVQGFEPYVFAGMGSCLCDFGVRTILMEYWPCGIREAGGAPATMLESITAKGFTIHELDSFGEMVPSSLSDIIRRTEEMSLKAPESYLNLVLHRV